MTPTPVEGCRKILTKPDDRIVEGPSKLPLPLTIGSVGSRGPTEKAPVGFAESLPTGTETETGMPVDAAALGALVFDR